MVPAMILAALFTFYPMVMSWYYSALDWNGFSSARDFIGLSNYRELLGDEFFWGAFGRSWIFVLVGVPIRVLLALLLAILLNQQALKMAPVFRTMFFMPVVTTAAVIGVVMTFVLSPYEGPVNQALMQIGILPQPVDFLTNPDTALWSVLIVQSWKNTGITMIYWLAALQTVPTSYYEAAKVDGAGTLAVIRHITTPILLPFAIVIIVLTANENLHAFAIVQAMTQGGPYFSTQVVEVYIYQTAFGQGGDSNIARLGYASAAGCFFGTAVLILALVQGYAFRRVSGVRQQLRRDR